AESIDEIVSQIPTLASTFREGLRSLLCVPLISQDEVIGALHFRTKKPNAYTEQDLRLAERIGSQIAGVIASAQLYKDLRETETSLRESEKEYRELSIKLQDAYLWMSQKKDKIEARKYIESIIFLTADDGRICGFTEEAAGMTKKSHSDLQGCNIQDILVFQEGQTFMDLIPKARPRMSHLTTIRFKNQPEDGPVYEAKLTRIVVESKSLFYIVLY
ncbi:MAG: GAF domain-containing protein, partial [Deltaproteobacteria bacterium]|nr:GAF domain-containing protein [Deltaproteobacteria bacterium]